MHWLLWSQLDHEERLLPTSAYHWPVGHSLESHVYTKIDLWHTCHIVHIAEGNEPKTTFWAYYGSYKWCVMPFGLTNTPAAFQHFIYDIFADLLNICTVIYLDDILIYSDSMSDHTLHVWEALQHLWDNRLYASTEKCKFHTTSVEYLGFILSPDSLTMDPAKSRLFRIGLNPTKSGTSSPSWVSPISTSDSSTTTLTSSFH